MKKYILLNILSAALAISAFSQEAQELKKLAVKANILPFLIDNSSSESYFLFSTAVRIDAEKQISKNKSLVFQLGYAGPVTFDIEKGEGGEDIVTNGVIAGLGAKFYLANIAPMRGAYIMPMINYSQIKLLEHAEEMPQVGFVSFTDIGGSFILGYQVVSEKNWVLDISTGAHLFQRNYYDSTLMESPDIINHNETGIKPVLGISIGKIF